MQFIADNTVATGGIDRHETEASSRYEAGVNGLSSKPMRFRCSQGTEVANSGQES